MRRIFTFMVLAAVSVILTLSGCATYSAKGVMPNLINPSSLTTADKLATKADEGITITVYPVTNEDEVKKFFDENLLENEILPVAARVRCSTETSLTEVSLITEGGDNITPMSPEEVYKVLKRDMVAKGVFWWFFGLYVGAPISAYHSYKINEQIKQDIGVEGDNGKLLKLGKITEDGLKGFLCFKVKEPASIKGKLKFIFQRNDKPMEYNLDLK